MFRSSPQPSTEATQAAIEQLSRWAQRARAIALAVCLAAGIAAGLFALDRLQIWAHVFILAYGGVGLGVGFTLYRLVARPALRRALRRRAERLAAAHGLSVEEVEGASAVYLV
jgi:hypothetical protein